MATRTIDVTLKLAGEPPTAALATVEDWDLLARARRAALGLALCWSAAGVTIAIPGLHFVLPPLLALTGPIVATVRFLQRTGLRKLEGPCPRCKAPGKFLPGAVWRARQDVPCDGCGNLVTVTAAQ